VAIRGFGQRRDVVPRPLVVGLAGLVLAALAAHVAPAVAAVTPWIDAEMSQIRLVASADPRSGTGSYDVGVHIRLASGWKTYWRHPGDAGIPTTVDWSTSENVRVAPLEWPAPRRMSVDGLDSFGYEGEVVLVGRAQLLDPGRAGTVAASVVFGVCREICIPVERTVALPIGAGRRIDPATDVRALIDTFRALVPSDDAGIRIEAARLNSAGTGVALQLSVGSTGRALAAPDAFVEGPAGIAFGRPTVAMRGGGMSATLMLPIDGEATSLPGTAIHVTVVDGDRAVERVLLVDR
jgi:suppressor for copper-sensitivity B